MVAAWKVAPNSKLAPEAYVALVPARDCFTSRLPPETVVVPPVCQAPPFVQPVGSVVPVKGVPSVGLRMTSPPLVSVTKVDVPIVPKLKSAVLASVKQAGIGVLVGVCVGVFVGVRVGVLVGVFVGVNVFVGVRVGIFVGVLDGVKVGVLVAVLVGVKLGV